MGPAGASPVARNLAIWGAFLLTAYGLVPLAGLLLGAALIPAELQLPALPLIGIALLVAGTALVLHCGYLFHIVGRGTPNPWDPPRRLVTVGAYRYVRNPIVLGYLVNLAGLALLFGSTGILAAVPVVWALAHLVILPREETTLEQRFGEAYRRYRVVTPRWLPRPLGRRAPKGRT